MVCAHPTSYIGTHSATAIDTKPHIYTDTNMHSDTHTCTATHIHAHMLDYITHPNP